MYRSESIINCLLIEVESLSRRITNIHQSYWNTEHLNLRERLINENKIITDRLNEIYKIANILKNRTNQEISLSSLLLEKSKRIIAQRGMQKNLFFL